MGTWGQRTVEHARLLTADLRRLLSDNFRVRRTCFSVGDASRRPLSVRRLSLRFPTPFEDCASVLRETGNLREFWAGWQPWIALPSELSHLRQLRRVAVLNTPIRDFPIFLSDCPSLRELKLRGTDIAELPARASGFANVYSVDLSNNDIAEIPDWVARLPLLSELILHDTYVTPDVVAQLKRLLPATFIFWSGRRPRTTDHR